MTRTSYLKGPCQHWGGHLEFPADSVGATADCPHCGQQTELLLATPPDEPLVPHRTVVFTLVTVVILVVGVAGVMVALNRARAHVARQKAAAEAVARAAALSNAAAQASAAADDPAARAGFRISAITVELTPGSSLTYAV